jgi:hypothetical protein
MMRVDVVEVVYCDDSAKRLVLTKNSVAEFELT